MRFEQLVKGTIYTDRDGVSAFRFDGMFNEYLAEFIKLEYDEEKGEYVDTNFVRLFTKFEVSHLIEG